MSDRLLSGYVLQLYCLCVLYEEELLDNVEFETILTAARQ